MLKTTSKHIIKKTLALLLLCITFQFAFSHNVVIDSLVSDSNKIIVKKDLFNTIKIPILKKGEEKRIWMIPALAWNNYDKTQLGVLLGFNYQKKAQFYIAPLYSTAGKTITGVIDGQFWPAKNKNLSFNIQGKRFSYLLFHDNFQYNKVRLGGSYTLAGKKPTVKHIFSAQNHLVWQAYQQSGTDVKQFFYQNALQYGVEWKNKVSTINTLSAFTQGKKFGSISNETVVKFSLDKRNNFFTIRQFAGLFLWNNAFGFNGNFVPPNPVFQTSGASNKGLYWLQKDYAFNDFYFDRNGVDPFFSKQIAPSEGGFYSLTNLGNTGQFLWSLNLQSDAFFNEKTKRFINIRPFVNVAFAKYDANFTDFMAEGGLRFLFFNECLAFNVPIVTTKNISENQSGVYGIEKREWYKKITFSVDFLRIKRLVLKK